MAEVLGEFAAGLVWLGQSEIFWEGSLALGEVKTQIPWTIATHPRTPAEYGGTGPGIVGVSGNDIFGLEFIFLLEIRKQRSSNGACAPNC